MQFNKPIEQYRETGDTTKFNEIRTSFVSYNDVSNDYVRFLKGHNSIEANKVLEVPKAIQ